MFGITCSKTGFTRSTFCASPGETPSAVAVNANHTEPVRITLLIVLPPALSVSMISLSLCRFADTSSEGNFPISARAARPRATRVASGFDGRPSHHKQTIHPHELSLLSDTHHPCVAAVWRGYRTFAMNLISISCVGSASRGVTRIVLATSGLFAPYASFRTGPATANAISMSVT